MPFNVPNISGNANLTIEETKTNAMMMLFTASHLMKTDRAQFVRFVEKNRQFFCFISDETLNEYKQLDLNEKNFWKPVDPKNKSQST